MKSSVTRNGNSMCRIIHQCIRNDFGSCLCERVKFAIVNANVVCVKLSLNVTVNESHSFATSLARGWRRREATKLTICHNTHTESIDTA